MNDNENVIVVCDKCEVPMSVNSAGTNYCTNEKCEASKQRTKGEDRVLTMDEARATVIRGTMMVVKKSMESFDKLVIDTNAAEENKKNLLRASLEFYATLEAQLRRFERPAILRSPRRMKVVR
jgi:hypothetical protein